MHDLAALNGSPRLDDGVDISSRESMAVVMRLFEDLIDAGLSSDFVRAEIQQ